MIGERYHLFRICAETCSFTAAGERAFRTQSAVSQSIAALESDLAVALFHRDGRKLRLTDAGEVLRRYCIEAEERERSLHIDLENLSNLSSGNVRLGASSTVACYWLPHPLGLFRQLYPGIQLHLRTGSSNEVVHWLANGDLDAGLITLPVEEPAIRLHPLLLREDVLICAPGSTLLSQRPPQLRHLNGVPFVLPDASTRTRVFLEELFQTSSIQPRVVMEVQGLEVIKRYVAKDFGVSIVPRMAAAPDVARGELEAWHLDAVRPRTLALAQPARRSASRATEALVTLLKSQFDPAPNGAGPERG